MCIEAHKHYIAHIPCKENTRGHEELRRDMKNSTRGGDKRRLTRRATVLLITSGWSAHTRRRLRPLARVKNAVRGRRRHPSRGGKAASTLSAAANNPRKMLSVRAIWTVRETFRRQQQEANNSKQPIIRGHTPTVRVFVVRQFDSGLQYQKHMRTFPQCLWRSVI
jgi:hypothetical protein